MNINLLLVIIIVIILYYYCKKETNEEFTICNSNQFLFHNYNNDYYTCVDKCNSDQSLIIMHDSPICINNL